MRIVLTKGEVMLPWQLDMDDYGLCRKFSDVLSLSDTEISELMNANYFLDLNDACGLVYQKGVDKDESFDVEAFFLDHDMPLSDNLKEKVLNSLVTIYNKGVAGE